VIHKISRFINLMKVVGAFFVVIELDYRTDEAILVTYPSLYCDISDISSAPQIHVYVTKKSGFLAISEFLGLFDFRRSIID